ncbi:MAG: hypothetical protein QF723_00615, partial [Phycisphaerales bacterium]|nr:hypothetical protein [Phycisphaerales bacterium]
MSYQTAVQKRRSGGHRADYGGHGGEFRPTSTSDRSVADLGPFRSRAAPEPVNHDSTILESTHPPPPTPVTLPP